MSASKYSLESDQGFYHMAYGAPRPEDTLTDNRSNKSSVLATSARLYVRRCYNVLKFTFRIFSFSFFALGAISTQFYFFRFHLYSTNSDFVVLDFTVRAISYIFRDRRDL